MSEYFDISPPAEPLTCDCKPCAFCSGEGEITQWQYFPGAPDLGPQCASREAIDSYVCPVCKGSGKFTGDCCVPGHDVMEVPA